MTWVNDHAKINTQDSQVGEVAEVTGHSNISMKGSSLPAWQNLYSVIPAWGPTRPLFISMGPGPWCTDSQGSRKVTGDLSRRQLDKESMVTLHRPHL